MFGLDKRTNMIRKILNLIQRKYAKSSSLRFISDLRKKGIKIGEGCVFRSPKTTRIDITRPSLVEIGNNVDMNLNFQILTHDWASRVFRNYYHELVPSSGKVKIGNNIYFGTNVIVLKGVTIGDNCVIGAGSVVNKNIPANSVAAGVPAKVICSLDKYFEKRKQACVEEAFIYARSIKERFGRLPVASDFWEEFPLFVDGKDVDSYPMIPIKRQLGPIYDEYCKSHKACFNGLNDFLKAAGIYEE